jgi:hypothetical protein
MNLSRKAALVASALTLTTGLAASTAAAAARPHPTIAQNGSIGITGTYFFNANGYTGSLNIFSQSQGSVQADLRPDGSTDEFVSGTWDDNSRTLILNRRLPDGSALQVYTFWLGGSANGNPGMFGGYFSRSDTGNVRYGAYLDTAL